MDKDINIIYISVRVIISIRSFSILGSIMSMRGIINIISIIIRDRKYLTIFDT